MAKGYKTKRIYRRKRRYKKKKYSVSIAKLASKKIDTLFERRMVQISQDQRVSLISRRYFGPTAPASSLIFGIQPNANVDEFSNNWNFTRFQPVSAVPILYTLSAIPKADMNNPLNNPQQPNDQSGVTRGMYTSIHHDRRYGNNILITGISIEFRLINDLGISNIGDTPPDADVQWTTFSNFIKESHGKCNFYYKVILNPTNSTVLPLDKDDATVSQIMKTVQRFGYSWPLDKNIGPKYDSRRLRAKVLMSGKVNLDCKLNFTTSIQSETLPIINITPRTRTISVFRKFDKPIQIIYEPTDQNGTEPENNIIYLAVKSDVSNDNFQNPIEQRRVPMMSVCTKVYYFEP